MPSPVPAAHTNSALAPAQPRDGGARMGAWIAGAILFVVPSLYSFQFVSFSHAKLAGLALGAALLAWVVPPERLWDRGRLRMFAPLAALLMWALAGAAGTSPVFVQSAGVVAAASYAVLLLAALLLLAAAPGIWVQRALAVSCMPVAVLALAQYAGLLPEMFPVFSEYDQRIYSVFGNQDLLGGYLAIGLALALALWLNGALPRGGMVALLATAFPALLLSGSRSAWLAAVVGCGCAVWLGGRAGRGKLVPLGIAGVLIGIVTIVIAPQSTVQRVAASFAEGDVGYRIRLWIWDGTVHLIGQHPVAGVGLGNYAYRSPLALGEVLHARGPGAHLFNHIHTQHAHSDGLEIAAEAGLAGLALGVLFVALIPRRPSPAWAGLIAAFVFSLINTTLHSPPHVLAVLLLAGSLAPARGTGEPRPLRAAERGVHGGVLMFAVLALGYLALEPSWKHARAQTLYDAGERAAALEAYRAAAYLPGNHAAAYEYAVALASLGRIPDALEVAGYAAGGTDTGDLHYLRAYLAERALPMRSAAEAFRACLDRWPDHRLAHEGLVRNSGPGERAALLAEAERWLTPEDYAAVTAQPSAPR